MIQTGKDSLKYLFVLTFLPLGARNPRRGNGRRGRSAPSERDQQAAQYQFANDLEIGDEQSPVLGPMPQHSVEQESFLKIL